VEAVAFLALAVERVAEVEALPLGAVDDLPQLDVAEVGKNSSVRSRTKRSESRTPWNWPRGTCCVVTSAEIACANSSQSS
jgi:hypothetical protein